MSTATSPRAARPDRRPARATARRTTPTGRRAARARAPRARRARERSSRHLGTTFGHPDTVARESTRVEAFERGAAARLPQQPEARGMERFPGEHERPRVVLTATTSPMEPHEQARLLEEARALVARGQTDLSLPGGSNPVDRYTDTLRLQREQHTLFRSLPILVGFRSQVRDAGDWFTHDAT